MEDQLKNFYIVFFGGSLKTADGIQLGATSNMAQPQFDKEGNLTNRDELSVEEVETAYQAKNREVFGRATEAEKREAEAKARADKAEAEAAAAKAAAEAKSNSNPPTVDPNRIDKIEGDLTDAKLARKGLSDEVIRFVRSYAKGINKDPLDVLEDDLVKDFIGHRKAKEDLANKIPSPSSRVSFPEGKDLSKMSDAEKQEHFEKTRKAKIGK